MERRGRYETGLAEIAENWSEPAFLPNTADTSEKDAAELLLRFAALLGFCGHNRQIANSQQRAKDILTGAHGTFLKVGDMPKAAECENYLALCYWRTGELNEAAVWVESALSKAIEVSEVRLYALVTRSLVLLSQRRYAENIAECERHASLFFRFGNAFLTGSYCTNIGLSFKNARRFDEALRYLELARHYHQLSGHRVYLGTVENNLAQLYRTTRRFSRAHASIDAAIRLFKQLKDNTREGFALDTKALVYFDERRFTLGLKTVEAALKLLRRSENAVYITETLQTKFRLLLFLNDVVGAVATLHEALDIARVQIGEEAAAAIFESFRECANERAAGPEPAAMHAPATERENLQLLLPGTLSRYEEYQGLWINNSHLEGTGLKKGSLAVVVRDEIKRGDLVAVTEIETDLVSCGFYDEDFGIVCLEGLNTEPQLFDSGAIKILGKIVGVCSGSRDDNGKLIVEPLEY